MTPYPNLNIYFLVHFQSSILKQLTQSSRFLQAWYIASIAFSVDIFIMEIESRGKMAISVYAIKSLDAKRISYALFVSYIRCIHMSNNAFLMNYHALICFGCQENPMIILKTSITSLSSCLPVPLCYIGSCRFIHFCYASFVSGMKNTISNTCRWSQ